MALTIGTESVIFQDGAGNKIVGGEKGMLGSPRESFRTTSGFTSHLRGLVCIPERQGGSGCEEVSAGVMRLYNHCLSPHSPAVRTLEMQNKRKKKTFL